MRSLARDLTRTLGFLLLLTGTGLLAQAIVGGVMLGLDEVFGWTPTPFVPSSLFGFGATWLGLALLRLKANLTRRNR